MSLGRYLAIGPSKICPVTGMADIFQNGAKDLYEHCVCDMYDVVLIKIHVILLLVWLFSGTGYIYIYIIDYKMRCKTVINFFYLQDGGRKIEEFQNARTASILVSN